MLNYILYGYLTMCSIKHLRIKSYNIELPCVYLFCRQLEDADIVRALLAAGADPGIHNDLGQTPYDLALTEKVKNVFTEELLQCTAQSKYV